MKRLTISLAVALTLAACGGSTEVSDDPATDTSGEPTTTTTTAAATTDTSGATTAATTAATTSATTEASTTTTAAPDPFLEAALAAAGTYEGTWTNTTFGSTGAASMTMTVSDSGDVTMEWDLGGGVFGAGDPDGENQVLNVSQLAGGVTVETDLFGEIEIAVEDDFATLTMDAENVPGDVIAAFRATATWMDDGTITGDYVVEFEGGGEPAVGEFTMTRA